MRKVLFAAMLAVSTPALAASPAPVMTDRAQAEAAATAAERSARDFYFVVAMTT